MYLKEKVFALFLILIAILAGLLFVWENLSGRYNEVPTAYGSIVEGVVGQPQILNPMFAQTDADRDISKLLFSRLMDRDAQGKWQGDLAEKFSLNEAGTQLTFTLRQNALWHDGKVLTMDDVLFSYQIVKRADYVGPFAGLWKDISVEKTGDFTLNIVSVVPTATLMNMAELPIIPKHLFKEDSPFFSAEFNTKPIGTGPFKFSKLMQNSGQMVRIELEANQNYFRGAPYVTKFILRFFGSGSELAAAIQTGEVSAALNSSLKSYSGSGLSTQVVSQPAYLAAFINTGTIQNKSIREALQTALNYQKLSERFAGEFGKAISIPIFESSDVKLSAGDKKKAKQIIETGKIDRSTLSYKLATIESKKFIELAEFLKQEWEQVGIDIEIKSYSKEKLEQVVIPERNFDILLFGQSFGYGADPFSFWHSSQIASGGNVTGWQNAEADGLLAKSRETISVEERKKLLQRVGELISADFSAVFLFQPNFVYGMKSEVKGAKIFEMQTATDRFATVEKWYIKTKRIRVK